MSQRTRKSKTAEILRNMGYSITFGTRYNLVVLRKSGYISFHTTLVLALHYARISKLKPI